MGYWGWFAWIANRETRGNKTAWVIGFMVKDSKASRLII